MKQKLRLALGIVSGRISTENLDYQHYDLLGYDSYKFGYYGKPPRSEVLEKCEDIICAAILSVHYELDAA